MADPKRRSIYLESGNGDGDLGLTKALQGQALVSGLHESLRHLGQKGCHRPRQAPVFLGKRCWEGGKSMMAVEGGLVDLSAKIR